MKSMIEHIFLSSMTFLHIIKQYRNSGNKIQRNCKYSETSIPRNAGINFSHIVWQKLFLDPYNAGKDLPILPNTTLKKWLIF